VIQLGTTLAVILYFWRELIQVGSAWIRGLVGQVRTRHARVPDGWYLILATIPVGIFGIAFSHQIETSARNLWIISIHHDRCWRSCCCGPSGSARAIVRRRTWTCATPSPSAPRRHSRSFPAPRVREPRSPPGCSGVWNRAAAARFSFLLSIPAVVLSGLYEARKIGDDGGAGTGLTGVALIFAFVVGLASIVWLMRWITKHTTYVFIYYPGHRRR